MLAGTCWAKVSLENNKCKIKEKTYVTNNSDTGPGSLRWAVDTVADGGTVSFDLSDGEKAIVLDSPIYISKSITIDGRLTDGNNITLRPEKDFGYEIFNIDEYNTNVYINDVSFTKGGNNGIYSIVSCNLNLDNCSFNDNYSGTVKSFMKSVELKV